MLFQANTKLLLLLMFLICDVIQSNDIGAESIESRSYEACGYSNERRNIKRIVDGACYAERDQCELKLANSSNKSTDEIRSQCNNRTLSLDPNFAGPCPDLLLRLETEEPKDLEGILSRVYLRGRFDRKPLSDLPSSDDFKRADSRKTLYQLANDKPNNVLIRSFYRHRLDDNQFVEYIETMNKIVVLDSDCLLNTFRRRLNYFKLGLLIENWMEEQGPGAELGAEARKKTVLETHKTLELMFDRAFDYFTDVRKLEWALDSIYDYTIASHYEHDDPRRMFIQELSGLDIEQYKEDRRYDLTTKIADEYDVDSEHGARAALAMSCNDHAFLLGLHEHCYKLIDHFGAKITSGSPELSVDWTKSSILLVNALTKSCDEDETLWLGHPPPWLTVDLCLESDREKFMKRILEHALEHRKRVPDPLRDLLLAYLYLDDTSDDFFISALQSNGSIFEYGPRLIERLIKEGHAEAGLNILSYVNEQNYEELSENNDEVPDDVKDFYLEGTNAGWSELPRNRF